ncbi:hypothetical protein FRC08_003606 [Ceratobasidium sp. 394]|nr:hypothetical protein FRC08_003606 [Ceratobasidium sp. 394]KAG9084249.1 hypothetical protein FS749_005370 [Ceratobasidium sp. UAMH 11750]
MKFGPTLSVVSVLAGIAAAAPLDWENKRALPEPVSVATAKTYLAALTVAADSNSPAYSRDLFPAWITISGNCDTRETILKRDGTNVVTDSSCAATSGSWFSVYDGATWTNKTDVDIDHMVPLKEAWVSGARNWTTAQRQAFANDVTRPQLLAVTDNVNQAKGDKDPSKWMPPLSSYHCTYVRAWITVKHYYSLTIDSAEKTALTNYLNAC